MVGWRWGLISVWDSLRSCFGIERWLLSLLKLKVDLERGRLCCWGRSMATDMALLSSNLRMKRGGR